ncbi:DUF5825 family protein [Streptacidiphilus sp. P02-A3a]|uniref:DUF5825 family protein n=1 Tax=Streptacidiphilus sp. P02-A3a TaxID=2704468 RepID=UPI0015F8F42F|nr:DUF5825 family protein [Streptacidiphilus sp. P02-A3a]QMU69726.1 hypothetical protein GXP74_17250 [Streptacidiphilus sp. P02-A3a]
MPETNSATVADTVLVSAWRDYDPVARALPGMALGAIELDGPAADWSRRLWELGARFVSVPGAVSLAPPADAGTARRRLRRLSLVRDLTARAVLVDWELELDPAQPEGWRLLSHLQPPRRLSGVPEAEQALAGWRDGHYLGKCLWRQGPGFVQIRDRRWGHLARFTVDEPHYQLAIEQLAYGAEPAEAPADAVADFTEERLLLHLGPLAWWLPYRVDRWTQEAMAI